MAVIIKPAPSGLLPRQLISTVSPAMGSQTVSMASWRGRGLYLRENSQFEMDTVTNTAWRIDILQVRMNSKRKTFATAAAVLALIALARLVVPPVIESRYNRTLHSPPYRIAPQVQALHDTLTILDLHADSLLWDRDLLQRSGRGHVDIPRLIQANVAMETFTVVTKVPRHLSIYRNDDRTDSITALAIAEGWPPATWYSLKARALYQAGRLQHMAERSKGRLTVIKTVSDLDDYLQQRQHNHNVTAALLGLEGAHALEGDIRNMDALYAAGFRLAAPTHFFDNDIAGSSSGMRKGGLSTKGREFIRQMEARHMLVDLAHASSATIADVTALATHPLVVSHTGVRGTCDNPRNLSDGELHAVAKTGGVIGIGYWRTAVCGEDAESVARAIRYAANIVGVQHVALGSDFDGSTTMPFDTTGIVEITDSLRKHGFTKPEIEAIMGGNTIRVLREVLPR